MRLKQISDALGSHITLFFEEGESIPKVSDQPIKYTPNGDSLEKTHPLNKEEITLLKLFRKIKNKKIREGVLTQLRGIIEIENQK